jgi:hypothetical protein
MNLTVNSAELIRTEELLLRSCVDQITVAKYDQAIQTELEDVWNAVAGPSTAVPLSEILMEDLIVVAHTDNFSTSVPATLQGTNAAVARKIYRGDMSLRKRAVPRIASKPNTRNPSCIQSTIRKAPLCSEPIYSQVQIPSLTRLYQPL